MCDCVAGGTACFGDPWLPEVKSERMGAIRLLGGDEWKLWWEGRVSSSFCDSSSCTETVLRVCFEGNAPVMSSLKATVTVTYASIATPSSNLVF